MELTFRRFELELIHPWKIARGSGTSTYSVLLLELRDATGVVGLGESAPTSHYGESVESGLAFLAKVDPQRLTFSDVPGSMRYLDSVSPGEMSAKCALNIALLDGAARLAGQAMYDYLGLGFREQHHVTSFSIGIDTPEVIRQKVLAAQHYPVLKLKVGVPGDQENFAALRSVSPTKPVRVDANEGWKTKEEALSRLEWLAQDGHIQFVEQPMPSATPAADWQWLKARSPLPIFADESYHTAGDLSRVVDCFHGVNVKLVKSGGISAGFEALSAARKAGLQTMIGCMIESSILISAAAHLAELCDYLDVDGNLLIKNDPYLGVTARNGILSFADAPETLGLRVRAR
jgi:L-alanine-DL-glutamate epimerase-like enolase superfamily enzyme